MADIVSDTFTGTNGTLLKDHVPDNAPTGGLTGWHGIAAYNKGALDGFGHYYAGGSSGVQMSARLYAGMRDKFSVYCDIRREQTGSDARIYGISIRNSEVAGESDAALETIRFLAQYYSATEVSLTWQRMAGGVQQEGEVAFARVAWAQNALLRLLMRVDGDQLTLYTAPAGTETYTLQRTITLATPWNDASHKYVGILHNHLAANVAFDTFGATPDVVITGSVASSAPGGTSAATGNVSTVVVASLGHAGVSAATGLVFHSGVASVAAAGRSAVQGIRFAVWVTTGAGAPGGATAEEIAAGIVPDPEPLPDPSWATAGEAAQLAAQYPGSGLPFTPGETEDWTYEADDPRGRLRFSVAAASAPTWREA